MDLNQPSKFKEDYEDNAKVEYLDVKLLVCDDYEKRTKLDVVLEVIFDKAHCKGHISHVF